MLKILYLHGLESEQGGKKVDFLSSQGIVHAPSINYKEKGIFQKLLSTSILLNPDLIIGSSMGGYMAFVIGGILKKQVLVFNPALHSRTFELDGDINSTSLPDNPIVILGENDKVVDHYETIKILNSSNIKGGFIEIVDMGHRTPLPVFQHIYNKYFNGKV